MNADEIEVLARHEFGRLIRKHSDDSVPEVAAFKWFLRGVACGLRIVGYWIRHLPDFDC